MGLLSLGTWRSGSPSLRHARSMRRGEHRGVLPHHHCFVNGTARALTGRTPLSGCTPRRHCRNNLREHGHPLGMPVQPGGQVPMVVVVVDEVVVVVVVEPTFTTEAASSCARAACRTGRAFEVRDRGGRQRVHVVHDHGRERRLPGLLVHAVAEEVMKTGSTFALAGATRAARKAGPAIQRSLMTLGVTTTHRNGNPILRSSGGRPSSAIAMQRRVARGRRGDRGLVVYPGGGRRG
jgi:hypothetical protein